jgi:hypothetical protein
LGILTPRRLDIAVKVGFFRHLVNDDDPESIIDYGLHINGRTGGAEPGSSKTTLRDYIVEACKLLDSMMKHGFDTSSPIVLCRTPRLRNGAHRLSCALTLGIVPYRVLHNEPGRSPPWDRAVMERSGLNSARINAAEKCLRELRAKIADCYE